MLDNSACSLLLIETYSSGVLFVQFTTKLWARIFEVFCHLFVNKRNSYSVIFPRQKLRYSFLHYSVILFHNKRNKYGDKDHNL